MAMCATRQQLLPRHQGRASAHPTLCCLFLPPGIRVGIRQRLGTQRYVHQLPSRVAWLGLGIPDEPTGGHDGLPIGGGIAAKQRRIAATLHTIETQRIRPATEHDRSGHVIDATASFPRCTPDCARNAADWDDLPCSGRTPVISVVNAMLFNDHCRSRRGGTASNRRA